MTHATLVIALATIGAVAVMWLAGRLITSARDALTGLSAIVLRAGVGTIFTLFAVDAGMSGGAAWIVVPLAGLAALWNLAIAVGLVLDRDRDRPHDDKTSRPSPET